jgi:hypothetical protein
MAITLTDKDISTRYALQKDFDGGFLGRDRQIVIKTDDPKGYRPIIMDGVTSGGKNKVALVEDLTDYLTKTEGSSTYATKTELRSKYATKTELSSKLDTSTANSTYATKTELSKGLGAKLDTSTANSTFATKTEVTKGLAAKLASATAASTYATKAQVPTITTGTEDLTAGSSSLATGAYHFVYE